MSFILDALRRAEAQRERGAVPGLHSQGMAAPAARDTGHRPARWATMALALLSLLLLGALLTLWWRHDVPAAAPVANLPAMPATAAFPPTASAAVAASLPARSQAPVSAPAPAPAPATKPTAAPVAASASAAMAARPRAPASAASPAAPLPASASVLLTSASQLPEPWRGVVSRLAFGGAVHSANPAQSFVMVGGQLVREGDTVAPEVIVERIGPRAAVLRAGPHRVEIGY